MSDDEPEKEEAVDERDAADDREEREHRRMDNHPDEADDASGSGTDVHDTSIRPDQPVEHDTGPAGEAIGGRDESQLDVPQITVDRSSRLDTAKQIEALPTGDRPVEIPQIQPNSTPLLDANDMEDTVLIKADAGSVTIPQFTPDTTDHLTPEELEDDQLEGIKRIQQVQIPQVTVNQRHRIRPFDAFLETVPEITAQDSDTEMETVDDEPAEEQESDDTIQVTEGAVDALSEHSAGDEWITGEWPDPLELLFGSGGTDVKSDNPMVVLVDDDDLVGVVETVVKRLYREKEGGEPELQKFDTADQLADEERWMTADSRIFTAKLPDTEWEKLEENEEYQDEWKSIWRNRFDQLFSGQLFGAIIFNRAQIPEIPGPEVTLLPHHPPTLVEIERVVDWDDIANVFWDLNSVDARRVQTFSQVFDRDANGVVQDRWIEILRAADGKFDLATNNDDAASDEHYALKVFVVKWLAEQLWEDGHEFAEYDDLAAIEDYREIEKTIFTEQPVSVADGDPVRPDVMYGPLVFEVEMFFEEANQSGVVAKLQQTVRKYEGIERRVDEINIVMDNLTCLLHLKDLARFKRNHRIWEEDYADITLYTVDLEREELIPLNEIVNNIIDISLQ